MDRKILLFLLLFPTILFAQKIDKEAKKIIRHEGLLALIESREFAIRTHTLTDRYGNQLFVNETTNFLLVEDSSSILQIAYQPFHPGRNGLGGETLEGRLTKYEVVDKGVGKGVQLRLTFFDINTFDLFITISDSGFATMDISGLRGERLRFRGQITTLENAGLFIGQTIF